MGASSYRLLDAANSNTDRWIFYSTARGHQKKLRIRGGFQAAFPLYHMNRHKQQTRRKNQTEANLKKEMKGSYQNGYKFSQIDNWLVQLEGLRSLGVNKDNQGNTMKNLSKTILTVVAVG